MSDTTYEVDREYKVPLYVKAGVSAWIVNIALRQMEFYGSSHDLECNTVASFQTAIRPSPAAIGNAYA